MDDIFIHFNLVFKIENDSCYFYVLIIVLNYYFLNVRVQVQVLLRPCALLGGCLRVKMIPYVKSIFYITSQSDLVVKQDRPHFVLRSKT